MHFAVDNTSTACLEHLLVAKADIDACDTYGRTPVWYAANPTRSVDAVRRLNNAGCNVDLSDLRWQRSPLQVNQKILTVPMLRLLSSEAQGRKDF